jgi:apolipoprotein N-acyltransferase
MAAGLLVPLAFAPFDLFPFAVLAPAALFGLWRGLPPAQAAWRGFFFGLGMFGLGVSWVYVSLHDFGNMPAPLAVVAVALFVAIMALFPALLGFAQAHIAREGLRLLLFLPAAWALLEWVRGWFLTGFPWLSLGYSQIDTALAGYAPQLGVYAVSWATALSAGLLVCAWQDRHHALSRYAPALLVLWLAGFALGRIEWVRPVDGPVRVALVQANVPLTVKWQPEWRQEIVSLYARLSAAHREADLIIWPETAVPAYLHELEDGFLPSLQNLARAENQAFLFGVVEERAVNGEMRTYNSVVSVGEEIGVYRKRHLVPFGEYLPLSSLLEWLLDYLHIPMSSFSSWGDRQPPLAAAGQKIGVSICYEDVFGEEVIRALPQATVLVNVSEDAWFGESFAPYQHLQKARMRALEGGRPLVRATNTGVTAVIDHHGRLIAQAPPFQRQVLTAEIQPMRGVTPYVRAGDLPVVLLLFTAMGLAGWRSASSFYRRGAKTGAKKAERR